MCVCVCLCVVCVCVCVCVFVVCVLCVLFVCLCLFCVCVFVFVLLFVWCVCFVCVCLCVCVCVCVCVRSLKSGKYPEMIEAVFEVCSGGYPECPAMEETTHLAVLRVTPSFSQHVPTSLSLRQLSLSLRQLLTSVLHEKQKSYWKNDLSVV